MLELKSIPTARYATYLVKYTYHLTSNVVARTMVSINSIAFIRNMLSSIKQEILHLDMQTAEVSYCENSRELTQLSKSLSFFSNRRRLQ